MADYDDYEEEEARPMKRPGVNRMSDLRNRGSQATLDDRNLTVGSCLDSLEQTAEMMHKSIAGLEEHLSPILARVPTNEEGMASPGIDEGDSAIVEGLRSLDARLGRLRMMLESINRRVQP